jgi:fatty acid desaturase
MPRPAPAEGLTLALLVAIYAAWGALTWFHETLPVWLWIALAGWLGAWWGSCQHECLHGHPTSNGMLNAALATPPLALWLPFERYRQTHLQHHRNDRLTDPLDDPESRYWTQDGWRRLGPLGRMLVSVQSTLAGRLTIGPLWSIAAFWRNELLAITRGDRARMRLWLWHAAWVALLLVWVVGICGVPVWQYAAGFVYLGTALTLIRSFAEHRAHETIERRTAIVERSWILGLLFLNNNLHVVHHRDPGLPWYRLQGVYRAQREALIAANGGLVYHGYRDVFRRFLLRPHDRLVHPTGRAPYADGSRPA